MHARAGSAVLRAYDTHRSCRRVGGTRERAAGGHHTTATIMQRDYLPAIPESCGMSSERLEWITTMLEAMVVDKSALNRARRHSQFSVH
eukprot:COSAG02_NODE_659_length_18772_cov_14.955015_24_plen_89_part_00